MPLADPPTFYPIDSGITVIRSFGQPRQARLVRATLPDLDNLRVSSYTREIALPPFPTYVITLLRAGMALAAAAIPLSHKRPCYFPEYSRAFIASRCRNPILSHLRDLPVPIPRAIRKHL
jgi:hypothetical protein